MSRQYAAWPGIIINDTRSAVEGAWSGVIVNETTPSGAATPTPGEGSVQRRALVIGISRGPMPQPPRSLIAAIAPTPVAPPQVPFVAQQPPRQPEPPPIVVARLLNPQLTAVEVDQPPFAHPGRDPLMDPIVASWQPGPYPPTLNVKLLAGLSVDRPIPSSPSVEPAILVSWIPPPPNPILPKQNAPGIPGQSTDQPIPRTRKEPPLWWETDRLPILPVKLLAGISVDTPVPRTSKEPPRWWETERLPILRPLLPPQVLAVEVDNPPFSQRTELTSIQVAWLPPPPAPVFSAAKYPTPPAVVNEPPYSGRREIVGVLATAWRAPDPLPTLPPKLVQPGAATTAFVPFTRDLAAVLYPRDPIALPDLGRRSAAFPGVSVDNPPFARRRELVVPLYDAGLPQQGPKLVIAFSLPTEPRYLDAIIAAWAPAPPAIVFPRPLPPIPPPPVNPPPVNSRAAMLSIVRQWWEPGPPMPTLTIRSAATLAIARLVASSRIVLSKGRVRVATTVGRSRVGHLLRRVRAIIGSPTQR